MSSIESGESKDKNRHGTGGSYNLNKRPLDTTVALKLWQRMPDSSLPERSLESIDLSKPTVLFFPGWGTRHIESGPNANKNFSKDINGYLKIIESSLGGKDIHESGNPVQLLSITYGEESSIRNVTEADGFRKSNDNPETYTTPPIEYLAKSLFTPIIRTPDGDLQDVAKVKEKLKNITFVSDSYGSVLAQRLYVASKNFLTENGYRPEQVEDILGSALLLNVNGVSTSLNPAVKGFPSIDFTNPGDVTGIVTDPKGAKLFPDFQTLIPPTEGKHKVEKLSARKIRITADSIEPTAVKIKDKYVKQEDRDKLQQERTTRYEEEKDPQRKERYRTELSLPFQSEKVDFGGNHNFQIYTLPREHQGKGSLVSLFQRSLCNAVKGEGREGSLEQLLSPTDQLALPKKNRTLDALNIDYPKPLSQKDVRTDISSSIATVAETKSAMEEKMGHKTSWVDRTALDKPRPGFNIAPSGSREI